MIRHDNPFRSPKTCTVLLNISFHAMSASIIDPRRLHPLVAIRGQSAWFRDTIDFVQDVDRCTVEMCTALVESWWLWWATHAREVEAAEEEAQLTQARWRMVVRLWLVTAYALMRMPYLPVDGALVGDAGMLMLSRSPDTWSLRDLYEVWHTACLHWEDTELSDPERCVALWAYLRNAAKVAARFALFGIDDGPSRDDPTVPRAWTRDAEHVNDAFHARIAGAFARWTAALLPTISATSSTVYPFLLPYTQHRAVPPLEPRLIQGLRELWRQWLMQTVIEPSAFLSDCKVYYLEHSARPGDAEVYVAHQSSFESPQDVSLRVWESLRPFSMFNHVGYRVFGHHRGLLADLLDRPTLIPRLRACFILSLMDFHLQGHAQLAFTQSCVVWCTEWAHARRRAYEDPRAASVLPTGDGWPVVVHRDGDTWHVVWQQNEYYTRTIDAAIVLWCWICANRLNDTLTIGGFKYTIPRLLPA